MWTPEKLYCELIFLLFGRTKVQKLMCIKNSFVSVRFCISSETIHFNLGILKCPEDINILRGKKKEKRVSFQCMVTSFYTFLDEFYRNNFFFFCNTGVTMWQFMCMNPPECTARNLNRCLSTKCSNSPLKTLCI